MLKADELLDRCLGPWIRGELTATPQPDEGATLTRPLRREDGRLDPSKSAAELERQVRAYQPWPGSFVETPAGRIVVWSASPGAPAARRTAPSTSAASASGAGERLWLIEVQPAGGKRMTWEATAPGAAGARREPRAAGSVTHLR